MSVTLADVARHAGVSLATASRVLNGSKRSVNDNLRRRVIEAAHTLQYVPNANAQALVNERSAIIGVIIPSVSDPYFAEIIHGIQQAASNAQRLVMVCDVQGDPVRELEYLRLLHAQRVEAIILAGSGILDRQEISLLETQIHAFTASGGRIAAIGRHVIDVPMVLPDNVGGASALANYLADLGHRNIGIINGPTLLTASHDRLSAFREVLAERGIQLDSNAIVQGDFSRPSGISATHQLLERAPNISAIFALNDLMAIGALYVLRMRGISVPQQISVVGYDDIPQVLDVTPALTTVHVPLDVLGLHAFDLALNTMADAPRLIHVPTRLIVRASAAAAAQGKVKAS